MFKTTRRKLVLALPILFLPLIADEDKPPTVDEIVANSIEARGGMAKIKGLQSVRMTGAAVLNEQVEAPLRIVSKRPNLTRFEIDVNGVTLVQVFDGKTSWSVNPLSGSLKPQLAPESQSREMRVHTDMDGLLVDWKAKGRAVELAGAEDVGGSPAWKLKITEKDGGIDYVYLDKKTWLMVKSTGNHLGATILFGDYRSVDGLIMPFSIDQNSAGGAVKMTLSKVETNVPVDDAEFRMPAAVEGKP
jgi:outer membrane lipoprotein-sorting protein